MKTKVDRLANPRPRPSRVVSNVVSKISNQVLPGQCGLLSRQNMSNSNRALFLEQPFLEHNNEGNSRAPTVISNLFKR